LNVPTYFFELINIRRGSFRVQWVVKL